MSLGGCFLVQQGGVRHRLHHIQHRRCNLPQRLHSLLGPLRVTRVTGPGQNDELSVYRLRNEGRRRRRHHIRNDGQCVIGSDAHVGKLGDGVRRSRQDQRAAVHFPYLDQAVAKPRDDPEVAAAPTQRPEQFRLLLMINNVHSAVGSHDLGGDDIVDGHPVNRLRKPIPPPSVSPPIPTLPVSTSRLLSVWRERPGDLRSRETAVHPSGPISDVDVDVVERAEIDEQPIAAAVRCAAVSSATHEEGQFRQPSCGDYSRDVIDMLGSYHRSSDRLYAHTLAKTATRLQDLDTLREGVTVRRAADKLWFYFGHRSWHLFFERRWPWDDVERWLADQASSALLHPVWKRGRERQPDRHRPGPM
jgi:hypothetical protein